MDTADEADTLRLRAELAGVNFALDEFGVQHYAGLTVSQCAEEAMGVLRGRIASLEAERMALRRRLDLVVQYLQRRSAAATSDATRAGARGEEPLARRAHEAATAYVVVRSLAAGEIGDVGAEPVATPGEVLAEVLPRS